MCGLCGMLAGDEHWSDQTPGAEAAAHTVARRAHRRRRVQLLNQVLAAYSCSLTDWQGSKYLVSTYTGKSELVEDLAQLWAAVERMTAHKADPLSPGVLNRLGASQ